MKKISIITFCLVVAMCASTTLAQRTAEDYLKASKTRLQNQDLDGALAALDKAIELKPDLAEAYFERHRFHMMKGAVDSAVADLDKALLIDPDMKQAYPQRARFRMMKNDIKGALSDLDNAVVRGYRSDEAYSFRGTLRMMTRDFEGAISDFNTAISMNPGHAGHYIGRGAAREASGDVDGAVADYSYLINRFEQEERDRHASGDNKPYRAPFITSPVTSGPEYPAGKGETSSTGKTAPDGVKIEAQSVVGLRLAPGMNKEKMEYLASVGNAYNGRGLIYRKRGDSDAAIADFNKSITQDAFFGTYANRAMEFRKRGDLSAAVADFTKAIELRPKMAPLYLQRGVTWLQMGKNDEAEKDFAQTLALDPGLKTAIETGRVEAKGQPEKKPQ